MPRSGGRPTSGTSRGSTARTTSRSCCMLYFAAQHGQVVRSMHHAAEGVHGEDHLAFGRDGRTRNHVDHVLIHHKDASLEYRVGDLQPSSQLPPVGSRTRWTQEPPATPRPDLCFIHIKGKVMLEAGPQLLLLPCRKRVRTRSGGLAGWNAHQARTRLEAADAQAGRWTRAAPRRDHQRIRAGPPTLP